MKKHFLLLGIFFKLLPAYADTCPQIQDFTPTNPPPGWTLIMPPILDDQKYYFGSAIHSLNGSFYYLQVLCKYEACPSDFCPAFALLSNNAYNFPNTKTPPWNQRSRLKSTFTCTPPDHDPSHCVFN
jgi:hypothetical protein